MKYLIAIALVGLLSSCSLYTYLEGRMSGELQKETAATAAKQGAQASVSADVVGKEPQKD